jgi:hypothetical protein
MPKATKANKVFISHGHNEVVKLKLKNFVRDRLGMEPVILAEQPDLGLTVVEKLEKYGPECDFALIVLTADDQTIGGGTRARQNVTHELGFFHGILGRDKVLLLKQSGVELFSNISGLIYKEFAKEHIELVFEDIRIALDSCSAQKGGSAVPKKDAEDISELVSQSLDIVAHDWPKMERDRIKQGMQQVISGLASDLHIRRIKKFLTDEKKEYETRLARTQAEAERRKETFSADPEHGGKMAAMTLSIFESIAPQNAIRLIDKLLAEVSFLETENVKPKEFLDRLISICDAGAE